jgi:hypothetical protein
VLLGLLALLVAMKVLLPLGLLGLWALLGLLVLLLATKVLLALAMKWQNLLTLLRLAQVKLELAHVKLEWRSWRAEPLKLSWAMGAMILPAPD